MKWTVERLKVRRHARIATRYTNQFDYEYVFVDVSPSLGLLNRAVLTSCDAFFMPATPDLFSMHGVRNIGQTLLRWKKSYDSLYNAVNPQIKCLFTEKSVQYIMQEGEKISH